MSLQWKWCRLDQLALSQAYALFEARERVFVVEQTCAYLDADGADPKCWHGLMRDAEGTLVATARLVGLASHLVTDALGLEVLRRLRARESLLPVLILTANDSVEQRVKGLDLGADDYMAKPFALSELEARVRALTRRGAGGGPTVIRHGPLSFDQVGRIAYLNDHMIDLSARELGLLEVLLKRSGRLVSKEQLVDHLCEWGEEVSNNAIEVYVHRLRKKIESGGVRIATVRGLGYCLEKFNTAAPAADAGAH